MTDEILHLKRFLCSYIFLFLQFDKVLVLDDDIIFLSIKSD